MNKFNPYITNDGSVGLFNEDINDIYHSATGALTEAYEKFIYPINFNNLLNQNEIKILDICYGIGYNSKCFLNFVLDIHKKNKKNIEILKCNEKIHNNNITSNNDKIYTNNNCCKILINAIDNDKLLTYLSPFITNNLRIVKKQKLAFKYEKLYKYINDNSYKGINPINQIINYILLINLIKKDKQILTNEELNNLVNNHQYSLYFDTTIIKIYKTLQQELYKYKPKHNLFTYLHNIYYKNISERFKMSLKAYNLEDIIFNIYNIDARNFIKEDKNCYNIIFLDAFTPSKAPCLWTYEFFKQLFYHLDNEGILLTYSMSSSIRSAMMEAGFYIGKTMNKNDKFIGTIATKNKELIQHNLSEFELGLLNTKSGIYYRDENLQLTNENIINNRKLETLSSDRMSTSYFIKHYKKK